MRTKFVIKTICVLMALFLSESLFAQIEIPVVAHIARKSDGTLPRVSTAQVNAEISRLNDAYNYLGITFIKCGENFVDNDFIWSQLELDNNDNKLLLDNYTVKNVANIFFTDLSSGSNGRAVMPYKQKDWVVVDYLKIGSNESTLIHEFGHYFGLHHTYSGVDDNNPASNSSLTISDAEGPEGWKYGDFLIDTPLDPENRNDFDVNCSYTGSQVDFNGDTFHPDGRNYMGKGHGYCRDRYSSGQDARMLEYIKRYRYYLECNATTTNNNLTCLNSPSVSMFPHNDNFERDDIDAYWVQARDGDDLNFSNGPSTPTTNSGPSAAQNGQTFVYLEASAKYTTSDEAILLSPCYDFSDKSFANIEFYYHMYGSRSGTLRLDVSEDGGTNWTQLFTINGEQHDNEGAPWTKQSINLDSYTGGSIQLRFSAVSDEGSFRSDISIDNVTVNASDMPLSVNDSKIISLKFYPNPVTNNLTISSPSETIESIEIFNMLGVSIYKSKINLNQKNVDLSYLSKGVYLSKIKAVNGSESIIKFVKD